MISLDDEQLDALMALAAPLHPKERARFLEAIAEELKTHPGEPGVGLVYRIGRQLQGRFLRRVSGPVE